MKKLEKMEGGGGGVHTEGNKNDRLYSTLLEINEKLIDCVKSVERVQKKEIIPSLKDLIALGGVGTLGDHSLSVATPTGDR